MIRTASTLLLAPLLVFPIAPLRAQDKGIKDPAAERKLVPVEVTVPSIVQRPMPWTFSRTTSSKVRSSTPACSS